MLHGGGKENYVPGFEIAGRVVGVGTQVDRFAVGDEVVALIPLDLGGGCAEFVCIPHYYAVKRPQTVDPKVACSVLGPGLRSILAFRRILRPEPGESIMILNPTSDTGRIAVQFALHLKLKVVCVFIGDTEADLKPLQSFEAEFKGGVTCISNKGLYGAVRELLPCGVDCILDALAPSTVPSLDGLYATSTVETPVEMAELIDCMAYGARWAMVGKDFQLDPPNALALHARNAVLGFVHEQPMLLSGSCVGELMASLNQLMTYLEPAAEVEEFATSPLMPPQSFQRIQDCRIQLSIPDSHVLELSNVSAAHTMAVDLHRGSPDHYRVLLML